MAYRKKTTTYRKKTTYKRRYKRTPTAQKAVRMVRTLARQVKPELKYFDYSLNTQFNQSGIVFNLLKNIQVGVTQGTRVGNKINPISVRLDGSLQKDINNNLSSNIARIIIFRVRLDNNRDFFAHGPEIEPRALLTQTSAEIQYSAPYHWNNKKRFKIVYDKRYNLSDGTTDTRNIKWNFRLHGQTTYVNNDPGIENNGLYLLVISDQPADLPFLQCNIRVLYTDV